MRTMLRPLMRRASCAVPREMRKVPIASHRTSTPVLRAVYPRTPWR